MHFFKSQKKDWIPRNVYFLIAATYKLNCSVSSPVEFKELARLDREHFAISREEYDALFKNFHGLPDAWYNNFKLLVELIWNDSKGHIGSIRCSLNTIIDHFSSLDGGHIRLNQVTEKDAIQFYMSSNFLGGFGRCFGDFPDSLGTVEALRIELAKCVYVDKVADVSRNDETKKDLDFVTSLRKRGLLKQDDETLAFPSPLAQRYTLAHLFRNRSYKSPANLQQLVLQALAMLSPNELNAAKKDEKFPFEIVFQAFMLKHFIQLTKPDVRVVPELSETFSPVPKRIPGRVDLYLNGDLRWGVELLVNQNQVEEHLDRFSSTGKYAALEVKDYVVIDFRSSDNSTIHVKHEHLATVIFDESFKKCSLHYGLSVTPTDISLGASLEQAQTTYI